MWFDAANEIITSASAAVATVLTAGTAHGQLVASRQAKTERAHSAEVAKRLLYGEVLFNLFALRVGAKVQPARLVLQNTVFRGLMSSGQIALLGSTDDVISDVGIAYAVSELTVAALDVDWLQLAVIRIQGVDCQSLEALAVRFRDAERALRPVAWSADQQKRVEEQLQANGALDPIHKPPLFKRVQNAGLSVPGTVLMAGLYMAVSELTGSWDERRGRKGRHDPRMRTWWMAAANKG